MFSERAAACGLPPLFFSCNIDGDALAFLEDLGKEIEIYLFPDPKGEEFLGGVEEEVDGLIVGIGVDLDEDMPLFEADLDWFIDDLYRCSHFH